MKPILIAGTVLARTVPLCRPGRRFPSQPGFFVQTNAADGNTSVAYDSIVKLAGRYATGGTLTGAVDRLASPGVAHAGPCAWGCLMR